MPAGARSSKTNPGIICPPRDRVSLRQGADWRPWPHKVYQTLRLRLADSDAAWGGFGWLRPRKDRPIDLPYIFLSSIVLALPGLAAGGALLYAMRGRVELKAWLAPFAIAMTVDLALHGVFARCWNRRANRLAANKASPPAPPAGVSTGTDSGSDKTK